MNKVYISELKAYVEKDNVIEVSLSDNTGALVHFTACDNWETLRRQVNDAIDIWEQSEKKK